MTRTTTLGLERFYFMEYYKNLDLADIKYFCEFDLIWKVEEWKPVVNYEFIYEVSDLGRVKSLWFGKEKILKHGFSKGYLNVKLCNKIQKSTKVHTLVAESFLNHKSDRTQTLVIDHINFDRTDSRVKNLKVVTARENANQKHLKSSSKYTGVCWDKEKNKWLSSIYIKGKHKFLGRFVNEIDASNAYQEKLKEILNGQV